MSEAVTCRLPDKFVELDIVEALVLRLTFVRNCKSRCATGGQAGSRIACCWCSGCPSSRITLVFCSVVRREGEMAHLRCIAVKEGLEFGLRGFVAAACDGVIILETADPAIAAEYMLVPMLGRLACFSTDIGFYKIVQKVGCDIVLAYIVFRCGRKVDW